MHEIRAPISYVLGMMESYHVRAITLFNTVYICFSKNHLVVGRLQGRDHTTLITGVRLESLVKEELSHEVPAPLQPTAAVDESLPTVPKSLISRSQRKRRPQWEMSLFLHFSH